MPPIKNFGNVALFQYIESRACHLFSVYPLAKVIWGGDFNDVFDENIDRWPPKSTTTDCELKHICLRMGLLDIWRKKNPQQNIYTWCNKNFSLQSRIDFWLISDELVDLGVDVLIEPPILTDHKGIFIKLDRRDTRTRKYGTGFWKRNNSLLENKEINNIIDRFWNQASAIGTYGYLWELMNYEIRVVVIKKGKLLAKFKKDKEIKIIKTILDLQMKGCGSFTDQEVLHLNSLQSQLDKIYEEKTKGAFIRSRRKWIEQGEKNIILF